MKRGPDSITPYAVTNDFEELQLEMKERKKASAKDRRWFAFVEQKNDAVLA